MTPLEPALARPVEHDRREVRVVLDDQQHPVALLEGVAVVGDDALLDDRVVHPLGQGRRGSGRALDRVGEQPR
jgi:hypothetical protein